MSEFSETTKNNVVLHDIAADGRGKIRARVDCPLVKQRPSFGWIKIYLYTMLKWATKYNSADVITGLGTPK